VATTPVDALLLSGGLDSSVLAALARPPRCITVGLASDTYGLSCERCAAWADRPEGCNADLQWGERVAGNLGLTWEPLVLTTDEAFAALRDLMRLRRSFDLGLLNDVPIYVAMRHAHRHGWRDVWTGDDADTLFGGYRFLRDVPDWGAYLADRIPTIAPEARFIAEHLGLSLRFPYLHPDVLAVARALRRDDIEVWRRSTGPPSFVDHFDAALMTHPEKPWGKAILRRVAERVVPGAIAWRPKTDLQFGSGMCRLETPLAALVDARARARLDATGIGWFNDAHRGLYLLFAHDGLTIPPPTAGQYPCRSCGAGVPRGARHCRTCGAYPAGA
jgi:asparagine synthase (glutamine-hydrolysing)